MQKKINFLTISTLDSHTSGLGMTKKKTQERMTTTTTAEHYNSAKRSTCTSSTGIELLHRNAYGRARLIQKTTHRESRWNPFHGARRKENKKNRTGAVRARAKTTTTTRTAATTTTTEKTVKKWTGTVVCEILLAIPRGEALFFRFALRYSTHPRVSTCVQASRRTSAN